MKIKVKSKLIIYLNEQSLADHTGPCVLEMELGGADGQPVHSVRELTIK